MMRKIISAVLYVDLVIIGTAMSMFQLVMLSIDLPNEIDAAIGLLSKFLSGGFIVIATIGLVGLVNEATKRHEAIIENEKRLLVLGYVLLAVGIVGGGYLLYEAMASDFPILIPPGILLLIANFYVLIRVGILARKNAVSG
jgi:uncharacterized membrane protein